MAKRDLCLESSVPLLVLSGCRNSVGGEKEKRIFVYRAARRCCPLRLAAGRQTCIASKPLSASLARLCICGMRQKFTYGKQRKKQKSGQSQSWERGSQGGRKLFYGWNCQSFSLSPPFFLRSPPSPFFCFPLAGREEGPKGEKLFSSLNRLCVQYTARRHAVRTVHVG